MILKKDTAAVITFLMVDASDDETSETGLSPTVQISKNGGAFAAVAGSVSEIGLGWYKVTLSTSETDTAGPLLINATGGGAANVFRDRYFVMDFADFKADTSALGTLANQTAIKAKTDNLPASPAAVGDAMTLTAAYDAAKTAASASTANAIKTSTDSIGDLPTAGEIADAVWDEALSGHTIAGSAGKGLDDAGAGLTAEAIADAVWDEDITTHSLEDSTGAALAGGVDPNAIADAVWDELIADHDDAGSFGEEVQAHTKSDEFPDETGLAYSIADAVWDELLSGHVGSGSTGAALGELADTDAEAIADAVWDEAMGSHNVAGTFGELANDINPLTITHQVGSSDGSRLVAQVGATYRYTMTGLTIPAGWTRAIMMIKKARSLDDPDTAASLFLLVTNPANSGNDGIVVVDGKPADSEQRLLGSLAVNQGAGETAVIIDELITALVGEGNMRYALKFEWDNSGESDETIARAGDFILEQHATREPIV